MYIVDPKLPIKKMEEYQRRNLLHASSVGANANARHALGKILEQKRPAKWLIKSLEGIIERTERVHHEMAAHRDEINVWKEVK